MAWLTDLLNAQPFLALFLAIGLGYAVGNIQVAGFSLGVGAVLFVGLLIGVLGPKSAPPAFVGLFGLVLFLYGVGIQYGGDFFRGLVSPSGIKANLLALVAVMVGVGVTMTAVQYMGIGLPHALGIFAGSLTSTGTLQAATTAVGNQDPAVGYACAYPFGVFGPILLFYLFNAVLRPKVVVPDAKRFIAAELPAATHHFAGMTLRELTRQMPQDVEIVGLRHLNTNQLPHLDYVFGDHDILVVSGYPESVTKLKDVSYAREAISDRKALDYTMVFVSKLAMVGLRVADVPCPAGCEMEIIQLRRGDNDIMPRPDLRLEYGDRLGLIVDAEKRAMIAKHFGDSVTAEGTFSFVGFGLGMALGALVGLIPIPIPAVNKVTLGLAGGPLLVSLVLGWIGRTGPVIWHLPIATNLVLRNVGLALFLARVGLDSGAPFVTQVSKEGFGFVLAGVFVLLAVVLVVLIVGYYLLRIQFDELLGIASGATGNPAILAYGNTLAPTGKPDINYAMIFPGVGTILKIIAVQVLAASFIVH